MIILLFLEKKTEKAAFQFVIFIDNLNWSIYISLQVCVYQFADVIYDLFVCRDEEDNRSGPDGSIGSFMGYKPNIEELEMLLEAYFVQIDGTLNKLSHVIDFYSPSYASLLTLFCLLAITVSSKCFLET
jgi:hypothetical protein